MWIFKYKKSFFLLLILAFALATNAQQNHFIYLQTDNGTPFYVKMDQKILSSSSEGYIILPDIVSGVYQLKVGFPKKEYPEESFSISVGDQNEGYLIKHFDDKGVQLFNMETLALISGDRDTTSRMLANDNNTKDTNPFTRMLANVVKDSTILQNHEVMIENPVKNLDSSKAISEVAVDSVSIPSDTTTVAENNTVSPSTNPADTSAIAPNTISTSKQVVDSSSVIVEGSPVSKLLSRQGKDGLQMVYADTNGNTSDTVRIFMPAEKKQLAADSEATNKENFDFASTNNAGNTSVDTSQLTITPTIIKPGHEKKGFVLRKDTITMAADSAGIGKTAPEQVFYIGPKDKEKNEDASDKSASNEKKGLFSGLSKTKKGSNETAKQPENRIEVLPNVATPTKENSDCKAFADNEDFLRLRKKMASEDSKEGMIKVANKFFKSRCFSTSQIKDLSYLFLTDEGKYMFFDAAYAHTSDSDEYATLESQLKDPYYQNRFEAMIKK